MIYRKIKKEEAKQFANLSATAFHDNAEDQYKDIEKGEYQEDTLRVLENEAGKFVAGLRLMEMDMYLDGNPVKCGGIGDVSSYPEYRRMGNISKLFDSTFEEMYENDYVISYLYPFSHPYYRKYGYEICRRKDILTMETSKMPKEKYEGYFRQHVTGTDDDLSEDIKKVYNEYAKNMNFMLDRKGWFWDRVLKKDAFTSKAKVYAYYMADDTPAGYFLYDYEKLEFPYLRASVMDIAFVDRKAFDMILRFMYRLGPSIKKVVMACPAVINGFEVLDETWEVRTKVEPGGMMRIVNVEKALSAMKMPMIDTVVSVKVVDENIKQNNDTFALEISGGKANIKRDSDAKVDLVCSIHVLSQLVCGFRTVDEVCYRDDVVIYNKADELNHIFIKKPIHTQDYF